ncbi:MAG TPA: hypothetical protein VMP01_24245, partial [Pirellulaceae bacterium]|nr:hypothetical protein [Pirellulaceae bacterium]
MKRTTLSVTAVGLVLCLSCAVLAQQPGGRGRGGFGGGGFGGFGGGGGLMLLGDENVRKEIGLSDDKYEDLQAAQRESFQQMGNLFQGLQDLSDDQRQARIEEGRKKMADAQKKIEEKYLTASQRTRLKELNVQSRLSRGGVGEGIASDEIASELGLSDADKEKIRKAAEEAQEKMRAEIQRLQEKAREEVIASLSASQQIKLKSMMG